MIVALSKLGIVGQMQNPDQLVVSSKQGPVWPNRGNSFWLSRKQGSWYLSTWAPVAYKVPTDQDILALCSACMSIGTSAMYEVPPELVERFNLEQLPEAEFEWLFGT